MTICVAVKKDEVVSPTAHRSGAAPIAIADPVAAPIAEDADHNGALSPRLTRGLHHSESRDVRRSFTFFEARSINFAIVVYSK